MTFQFKPNVRYRMPVVFGPSVSPRQHPEGRPWKIEETGMMDFFSTLLTYRADAAQLTKLLPPGFSLRGEPSLVLGFMRFSNLYWLAGRGYGALSVYIPVTYEGKDESIDGLYMLALWEGDPNAIMTGREEMGFPKLFANIPEAQWSEDKTSLKGQVSWYDHTFFEIDVNDMVEVPNARPNAEAINMPNLWYKYMPKTAVNGTGGADTICVTTNAPHPVNPIQKPEMKFENYREWSTNNASIKWHSATFEQLPLIDHIVNGIADIKLLELVDVTVSTMSMSGLAISCDELRMITPKDEHLASVLHPGVSE